MPRASHRDPLQVIPGIGPSLAADLRRLGVRRISDLRRRDPERMYRRLERLTGSRQDRCVLYTFRCAVYYARTPKPAARWLRWWNWTDARMPRGPGR
ncbi:MAG TPA: helix-hairpin-helix domain-containing protein [Gemmatimonadales bacterium]|nr:helix-hairpin-helix domain-containing protein [Gemmatimonadales bacterium]